MSQYIYSLKDITCLEKEIGGKAASLIKMKTAGLPVPDGYVICATGVEGDKLKSESEEELEKLIALLSDELTYAVRSSAGNEDSDTASFAGAYETITNISKAEIPDALKKVISSANTQRVQSYARKMGKEEHGIAVVIQRFVNPEFAGVLFTVNPITGNSAVMKGNYVCGEGEILVSGNANAEEFSYNSMKYAYSGPDQFKKYARKLYLSALKISKLYQMPMDLEWAVSDGKLYILQARPITNLRRFQPDTYEINGSLAGEFLFSRTNVGEIFTCPVSPITFSILENVCKSLGMPCFIDNICGQPYANISVVCSILISFGFSRTKAYNMISEIAGAIPEDIEIPVFPYHKRLLLKAVWNMLFPEKKKERFTMSKREFREKMGDISDQMIGEIRAIQTAEELQDYWTRCDGFMTKVLSSIVASLNTKKLLNTRNRLEKVAGIEMANNLLEGCAGNVMLESMKPLLCLEKVMQGEMTVEEYRKKYGHRSATEMELARPYPYEDADFPNYLIQEHKKSGINVHQMQVEHNMCFQKAMEEFQRKYPQKTKWVNNVLEQFSHANQVREEIRSRGVKLFCLLREFLLKAGEVTGVGDNIFFLYFNEVLDLLGGNSIALQYINIRKKNYEKYLTFPAFPNLICGRFAPEMWMKDENRRMDVFSANITNNHNMDIKGFAGAAGVVEGKVRVLYDLSMVGTLEKGEILVTTATNIGWTIYFPRAAAIITDIGAPLSHAAIVAREFGIPAVVGCQNATTLLHTGDIVRVDGGAGTVEILK